MEIKYLYTEKCIILIKEIKETKQKKWRGTKEPLEEGNRGEWKPGLKLNIQKMKIMSPSPITSWQIDEETMETVTDFYFPGLQNHCRWWLQL